jgi:uroporphyrin-III C-methyltransferase
LITKFEKMQKNIQNPELFVLGAGPGDPELITMKGYKVLQQANVILYDNLANKELLALAVMIAKRYT